MPTKSTTVSIPTGTVNSVQVDSGSRQVVAQSGQPFLVVNSFTGASNPKWRWLLKAKRNATSLATGERRDYVNPWMERFLRFHSGSQVVKRWSYSTYASDLLVEPSISPLSTDSEVRNQALSRFLRNAKGKQRQFQGGVFLGELRETIHLVRHPLSGLRELLNQYVGRCRSRRNLQGRDLAQHLSNQWLEFSFGALPLISDVEDGVSALVRLRNKRYCVPVKGFYSLSSPTSSSIGTVDGYAGGYRYERHISYTASRKIVGEVYCKSNGDTAEIRQSLGLTVRDFIPTAYELIPWSFLVDYFSNLGEILDAWSFCQGDLAWYSDTFRREGLTEVRMYPDIPTTIFGNPVDEASGVPYQAYYRYRSFVRDSPVLGLPSLGFRLPGTSTKFLNIAALASLRVL